MTADGHDHTAPQQLAAELTDARRAFLEALADVAPELLTTPGLAGEWSARELVAHLGYWTGHAAEALHFAQEGRADEFGASDLDVDERNAVVARVALETDLGTVRKREEAAFDALIGQLAGLDPALLGENVAYGDTLEQVIRDDGPDHYQEHAIDIRAWFTGADEPDDDEDPEVGES
jgi:Mycothiol maleylpyruvate isomerase N-terminal domain.